MKYADTPYLIRRIKASSLIDCLALLRGEMFASSSFSCSLTAYSLESPERLRVMRAKHIDCTRDLALCPINNCLYLVDADEHEGRRRNELDCSIVVWIGSAR